MDTCRLVIPDIALAEEIASYRQAFLRAGDSMDGTGSLRRHENPEDWLAFNALLSKKETAPPNLAPCTQLVCLRERDRRIVGMIQIRHGLNDYLRRYAGHIGYSVRPDERRRGYAAFMLREALPLCKALGIERVMVSCETGNEGSRRTILKNGGVYESTVHEPEENIDLERYWIAL